MNFILALIQCIILAGVLEIACFFIGILICKFIKKMRGKNDHEEL